MRPRTSRGERAPDGAPSYAPRADRGSSSTGPGAGHPKLAPAALARPAVGRVDDVGAAVSTDAGSAATTPSERSKRRLEYSSPSTRARTSRTKAHGERWEIRATVVGR